MDNLGSTDCAHSGDFHNRLACWEALRLEDGDGSGLPLPDFLFRWSLHLNVDGFSKLEFQRQTIVIIQLVQP